MKEGNEIERWEVESVEVKWKRKIGGSPQSKTTTFDNGWTWQQQEQERTA
ncbi:hypothetical protein L195_g006419, partial [Trifolium pratense]